MPVKQPVGKLSIAPVNRTGRIADAARQVARETIVRWREHQAGFMFAGTSVLVSFASMLAAMFTMRWISPEDRGLWDLTRTALPLAMLALAGVNNGLSRELPYYFGRSDEKTAKQLAGTTLSYISIACLLVSLVGLGSLYLFRERDVKFLLAVASVTGLTILTFYTNYLIVTYRSSKAFRSFSKIQLGQAVLTVATIPVIAYFGFGGMLTRTLILGGVVVLLMHRFRPVRISPAWDSKSFWLLLKTGAPIFIFDYFISNVSNCDRWVLAHFGGLKVVGYFALATMVREAISKVPDALGEYIYPRMSHSYGQHHDPVRLWRMAVKSSLLVVAFMIPAAAAGWFLMAPMVSRFFSQYTEAVGAAQWILVASIFSGATLGKMAIWSMKDWTIMAWYQILYGVFLIAGPVLGGCFGKSPLIGVSIGILVSQAVWVPVAGYLVYVATHRTPRAQQPGAA
jgi:O-antigen/teichoic acid export membrane protein